MTALAVSTTVGLDTFPQAIRSLTTLPRVDYADLFTARTAAAQTRSPEEWARTLLEETPLARRSARRLWRLLGLRLGPQHSSAYVQGWRIADRGDGWIRVETGSWYMSAQAILHVDAHQVSMGLFLRYQNPIAAAVWAPVGAMHRRGVPVMLRQAVSAVESSSG